MKIYVKMLFVKLPEYPTNVTCPFTPNR